MIVINSPRCKEEIIALLENQDGKFTLTGQEGLMKLVFDTTLEDKEEAAKLAKSLIKSEKWGGGIYFQVEVQ